MTTQNENETTSDNHGKTNEVSFSADDTWDESSENLNHDELCGCGIPGYNGIFKITGLQAFAKPIIALVLFSTLNMLQQIVVNGLSGATVSTIEKRFQLQSAEMGWIASLSNIGNVITLILLVFVGESLHKPRWIGIGVFVSGVACISFTLPHFLAPRYNPDSAERTNMCYNTTISQCSDNSINLQDYKYIFGAAMLLLGLSKTTLISVAIVYLDEHCSDEVSPVYNSIFYGVGGFGPAVGYLLGGATLELYTYLNEELNGLTSDSYAWVGAWWIGYVISGILLITISSFIYILPKNLPNTKQFRKRRNRQAQNGNAATSQNFLTVLFQLLKNKIYVGALLCTSLNTMFIYGFNAFGAKYLESQFGFRTQVAPILYGTIAIFAGVGAHLFSGYIIKRFQLKVLGMIKYMAVCSVVSAICSLGFLIHCPDEVFATEENSTSISMQCNSACNCSTDFYEPVCGSDDVTYFSPCHAGCLTQVNETSFGGCECVQEQQHIAMFGKCDFDNAKCYAMMICFAIMLFCGIFTSIMTYTPSLQVVLRCVAFNTRVRAVAVSNICYNIVGCVSGQILTGVVVDLACKVWQTECDEQGSCVVYNRWEMARNMALTIVTETSLMVVIYLFMITVYQPNNEDLSEEEEEECKEN